MAVKIKTEPLYFLKVCQHKHIIILTLANVTKV